MRNNCQCKRAPILGAEGSQPTDRCYAAVSRMNEPSVPTGRQYRVVQYGGGVDEVDRFGIRDRIRSGDVVALTEIAVAGTDEWRAAATYPEFARYFEMAATSLQAPGSFKDVPRTPVVAPVSQRLVTGLLYPIAGGEAFMLIGLALLSMLPFFGWIAKLASTMIMVEIIRTSADGRMKMPLVDTSQAWHLIRTYLRVVFVSLVSLLPVFLFGGYALGHVFAGRMTLRTAAAGVILALAFSAVYYPACLATVAVWDNVVASLNPAYVLRVIRHIGRDYFVVVGMWFVATSCAAILSSPWISPLAAIPIVGALFSAVVSYWALFYVSHLLGYAVHRHALELGWQ